MDTWTTGEIARALYLSVPTLHSAVERLGLVPGESSDGHLRLSEDDVLCLVGELGVVPVVDGFSRQDIMVLAALARHCLGLRSARAVARAASVSPTTVTAALQRLQAKGIVSCTADRILEGRVRDVTLLRINLNSPRWQSVRSAVAETILPVVATTDMSVRIPRYLAHLFWNIDLGRVEVRRNSSYIAARLMMSQDPQAFAWAAGNLSRSDLDSVAAVRGVEPRTATLAQNMARVAAR